MLIPVVCKTNLDDYKGQLWPRAMYSPKVGDTVRSARGMELQIVRLIHVEPSNTTNSYYFKEGPYLEVELYHGSGHSNGF